MVKRHVIHHSRQSSIQKVRLPQEVVLYLSIGTTLHQVASIELLLVKISTLYLNHIFQKVTAFMYGTIE